MPEFDIALGRIKETLDRLSQEVTDGVYSPLMLKEFKSSVDQLRLTLWAVIEVEDQSKKGLGGATMGLSRKVAEFRIKRLIRMLDDFRKDVTTGAVSSLSPEVKPLFASLRATSETLSSLS